MITELKKLDAHLQALRPDYYNQLYPGLTDEAIAALEQKYQRQLPDELKLLYKWKNGQPDRCFEAFVNNSMFEPLEQALRSATSCDGMIGYDFDIENWWNVHWFPIFHNGSGDWICCDTGGIFTGLKGQILMFYHDYESRKVIAPSLVSLLQSLNDYYNQTPKEALDEVFKVNPIIGYPKNFRVDKLL